MDMPSNDVQQPRKSYFSCFAQEAKLGTSLARQALLRPSPMVVGPSVLRGFRRHSGAQCCLLRPVPYLHQPGVCKSMLQPLACQQGAATETGAMPSMPAALLREE